MDESRKDFGAASRKTKRDIGIAFLSAVFSRALFQVIPIDQMQFF